MITRTKRLKTPTVLQMESTECGAAALAIIFSFYELYIPLEELRIECGVSRDGSNALNVVEVARKYGFKAQGAKVELDQLNEVKFPAIAFWEFNHFVVIEAVTKNKVYINDPDTGPRNITHQDFDRSFTGVMLIFEPTSDFKKSGVKTSPYQSLLPKLKTIQNPFAFVTLLSIALVIPGLLIPAFTKVFIDNILIQRLNDWLIPLLWGLFFTGLLRALLSYLEQYYLLRLQLKITLTTSSKFVWHVLRLPYRFFSQRFAGDVESRIESNDRIAQWLSGGLSLSLVSLVSMLFYVLIMFFYDWTLTLVGILVAILNASLLFYVGQQVKNNSSRLQQEFGKLMGLEMNGLQAIETLKATSSEDAFFQQWAGYHARTLNSQQKIQLYGWILQVVPMLLNGLLIVTILGLGGWRIMQGHLTVGGLVAFQTLLMSFNAPLLSLIGLGSQLQQLRGDLLRLEDVNKHPEDVRFGVGLLSKHPEEGKKIEGSLVLKDVSFGYAPLRPPLLKGMSLTLNPGQKIAIVGASGSGKSTLAKLICSLYQPWSGEILLHNVSIGNIPLESMSKSIAFVDQDIFLFEGTIHENITLWDNAISSEKVKQAIADVCLESVVALRPHRLGGAVANAGSNFSGGQRQQLEIARALALEPAILVLDEATAALDSITEAAIMENLKRRGCSLLVIAHRLSAVRDADEIIVLENGVVRERGTHETLYPQKGAYYRLMQTEGEEVPNVESE